VNNYRLISSVNWIKLRAGMCRNVLECAEIAEMSLILYFANDIFILHEIKHPYQGQMGLQRILV